MADQLDLHGEDGWGHNERRQVRKLLASDSLGVAALLMTLEGVKLLEAKGIDILESPHACKTIQEREGEG